MSELPSGPLVSVREQTASYSDVVLAGVLDGSWDELIDWCATSRALARIQSADPVAVRRGAEEFRRQRHLESGEDLRGWLAERELSVTDWEDFIARRALMSHHEVTHDDSVQLDDLAHDLRVDAFCRDYVDHGARRLVTWMAAVNLVGEDAARTPDVTEATQRAIASGTATLLDLDEQVLASDLMRLASWSESHDRVASAVTNDTALDAMLERHWLDWSQLELDVLELASESAAREAMSCATEDGLGAPAIARRANIAVQRRQVRSGDLESSLSPVLLSVPLDQPVGPLNYDGHWRILWVRERSVADRSDESVRNIAQRALVDEAVDGAAKGHVKWHGPL